VNLRPKFKKDYVSAIVSFIAHHFKESDKRGLVLGISGGLDSSVIAKLCVEAIGPSKLLGLMMRDDVTTPQDIQDAKEWAKTLKISFREIDISDLVKSFQNKFKIKAIQRIAIGNVKARCRMIILYNTAALENRLVIGTSNKSELLTGYFTKFGDGAADFMPLGDLYKTQVKEMGKYLGVPPRILRKVPTANLWKGQTDEKELGISYTDLDRVLLGFELQLDTKEIAQRTGLDVRKIKKVEERIVANIHKRKMPLIPKLGIRTLGLDWRE